MNQKKWRSRKNAKEGFAGYVKNNRGGAIS